MTTVDANGEVVASESSTWGELKGAGDLQITVVGDKPVVLDAAAGNLFLPGGKRLQLDNARDAKLQQGGPGE